MLQKKKIAILAAASATIVWTNTFLKEKRHHKKKRIWVTELFEQRRRNGFYYTTLPILKLEDLRFRNYFRMNTTQFEELLQLIGPKITRQHVIQPLHKFRKCYLV